jgi:hypothetical protein
LERLREALAPDYSVEREIATGGMGTVYLGRDERLARVNKADSLVRGCGQ